MTSTAIVGSTGLVGAHILSTLIALPSISSIHTLARREPSITDSKLVPIVSTETAEWASKLSSITPPPAIFYSGLGTTKAAAGSVEKQRLIDYDLNLDLAKAAKASGIKVYVLISSGSASSASRFPYIKMKGELEDSVKVLDFDHTIILRPGLIAGDRAESRPAEFVIRKVANFAGAFANILKDSWAQEADVIAKAAVSASLKALEGDSPKILVLGQGDIIRLGRTEWKI